ncbi:XdhC family protein [Kiloniella antarctica]|uniref:XdhC family protein n=1 Tax=Kiloniella antarctica TaxID=1550907 RepID=A0ABW5BH13_9PROT
MTTSNSTLDLIEKLRAEGTSFCIATILRTADSTSARPGAKAVIIPDGDLFGFVGGGCVTGAVRRGALECLQDGQPKMIRIKPKEDVVSTVDIDGIQLHRSSCPSGGTIEVFLEPMRAPKTLLICGASPIAQAILPLAKGLGYRVIVATAKEDQIKMPDASLYLDDFNLAPLKLSTIDAVIVATQGKRDSEALRAIVTTNAGYKGMVCSRKKITALTQRLCSEDQNYHTLLQDLHAPAGLHIGAIEPEEIALSVISEIVSYQRLGLVSCNQNLNTKNMTA